MRIVRRTQIENLKDVWPLETDFSNWLVTDDGLSFLAEDLGIEIEDARRESRPGTFPCDIVGHLVGNPEHVVVVENQWGRTNHDHLGKMLTYAAVHQALTAVWIAEKVAEDHRAVVDWLNANTPETVSFYLAEIKAYRIGDSPVSPQLDVLCRPNYSIKPTRSDATPGEQERRSWRVEFWTEIQEAVRATRPPFNLQRPSKDHWSSIAIGRSHFHINMLLTPRNRSIAVDLNIQPEGWKDDAYRALEAQKEAIEAELGVSLKWLPMPDNISARIVWEHPLDPDDPNNRQAVIQWFAATTPRFCRAFRDRVRVLKAPAASR